MPSLQQNAAYVKKHCSHQHAKELRERFTFVTDGLRNLHETTLAALSGWHDDAARLPPGSSETSDPTTAAEFQTRRTALDRAIACAADAVVQNKKRELFAAEANSVLWDDALGYQNNTYRKAKTLDEAKAALAAWVSHKFHVKRSTLIEWSKLGAIVGGRAPDGTLRATVWKLPATSMIQNKATHLTIYNNHIRMTTAEVFEIKRTTTKADCDAAVNKILATGSDQGGIHLTAEFHGSRHPRNPHLFGNPPDRSRFYQESYRVASAASANGTQTGVDTFETVMIAALESIKAQVWRKVEEKIALRRAPPP